MTEVRQLYTQLSKAAAAEDAAKIVTFSDRILAVRNTDFFALMCKGTLHLHQGKYDAAMQDFGKLVDPKTKKLKAAADQLMEEPLQGEALSAAHQEDQLDVSFSIAYCQYRLGRFAEARDAVLEVVKTAGGLDACPPQVSNLLAQAHYNLEEYESAAKIYEELLKAENYRDEQEAEELTTNLSAAYAALNADKAMAVVNSADEKTADLLYNAATAQLEAKRYGEALKTMDQAALLCARECEGPEDFLSLGKLPAPLPKQEREYFDTVAMIQVQRAFLLYAQGNEEGAEEILAVVLQHKPRNVSVYAVASTNWAAIKRHKDFFDSHRKLKHALSAEVEAKLTKRQRLLVQYNHAMLLLHTGRIAACRTVVDTMAKMAPDSELVPLALVACLLRDGKTSPKVAEEALNKFFASNSSSGAAGSHQLTLAQIKLEQGDLQAALQTLRSVERYQHRPATVATLAEGYAQLGELEEAKTIVDEAVAKGEKKYAPEVLRWAGQFFMRYGATEYAAAAFEKAVSLASKPQEKAKLVPYSVLALASVDEAKAADAAKSLPQVAPGNSDVAANAPLPKAKLQEVGYKRATDAEHGIDGPQRKVTEPRRRTMRRPPKDKKTSTDGKPKIDPERWIPMNIRTYIVDLPPKRKRDLRRERAAEQMRKRKEHEKRKKAEAEAAEAAAAEGAQ